MEWFDLPDTFQYPIEQNLTKYNPMDILNPPVSPQYYTTSCSGGRKLKYIFDH